MKRERRQCLKDFFRLSGRTPLLPRYALENWWSRFYPYTEESYHALLERFQKEQVPFSVAVLDMDWHVTNIAPKYGSGWTGYTWNREYFPEPERFLKYLHQEGMHVTLNVHPAEGVTLMIMRVMLAKSGAINILLQYLGFISRPLPYMLFVTTPYLLTNFMGNINDFNAIYLLNDGNPATLDCFKGAGKTDILVTWLYKLTMENRDYCYASAIGIIIFIMSAVLPLIVYRNTGAYKKIQSA